MRFDRSSAVPFLVAFGLVAAACSSTSDDTTSAVKPADPSASSSGGVGNSSGTTTSSGEPGQDSGASSSSSGFSASSGSVVEGCGVGFDVKCKAGEKCEEDADCNGACSYAGTCVDIPSCKNRLGGDTCGKGEVGTDMAQHESCCRSLPVKGFADGAHQGKEVYLDKYEITTGRVRAFLEAITKEYGKPDVARWIAEHPVEHWNPGWSQFVPTDKDGATVTVKAANLGDPRPPPDGHQPVPTSDQPKKMGSDFQFNGELPLYLHGNNCGTQEQSFGYPTFFYPGEVLAKLNAAQSFPPRADGKDDKGVVIPASEHLEVKSMNCISNAMLVAFCAWDGGQLATDEVLDFVTASPPTLGDRAGCGTQIGGTDPPGYMTDTANPTNPDPEVIKQLDPAKANQIKGGRCADLDKINATFDAGGQLPKPNHPANKYSYMFPFFGDTVNHDKAWVIAAPGRGTWATNKEPVDMVSINPGDEPWMDLHGNVMEAALKTQNGTFTGKFGLKYRGIGYQSMRSHLNVDVEYGVDGFRRIERAEARSAGQGGRCMRFR